MQEIGYNYFTKIVCTWTESSVLKIYLMPNIKLASFHKQEVSWENITFKFAQVRFLICNSSPFVPPPPHTHTHTPKKVQFVLLKNTPSLPFGVPSNWVGIFSGTKKLLRQHCVAALQSCREESIWFDCKLFGEKEDKGWVYFRDPWKRNPFMKQLMSIIQANNQSNFWMYNNQWSQVRISLIFSRLRISVVWNQLLWPTSNYFDCSACINSDVCINRT